MKILRARSADLDGIAPLFDAYRQFYGQESDIPAARNFLETRLSRRETVVFFAKIGEKAVGFTQLFPIFSSVSMERSWLLNDLFVLENFRKNGVGEALLLQAQQFVSAKKHKGLLLETAADNASAQRLYERLGWHKESDDYWFYFWKS